MHKKTSPGAMRSCAPIAARRRRATMGT
jgi:hypothetical protein